MIRSKEYKEGFRIGRENAEGFHRGTMNARDRAVRALSPYSNLTQPKQRIDWMAGRLDGDEAYWKDKESITALGTGI